MNTILTDDEIKAVCQEEIERPNWKFNELRYARAIEAAVLTKLAQQPPDVEPDEAFELGLERVAYYTHPAPQQADRQRVPDGWREAVKAARGALQKSAIFMPLVEAQDTAIDNHMQTIRAAVAQLDSLEGGTA